MAKKILLTSGCSYTDGKYKSCDPNVEADWPMWPEIMANELGLQCVNKGRSGQGADYILDTILEGLATYGDRVDTVAILWSTSDRLPFFNFTLNPIVEILSPHVLEERDGFDPFTWMDDIGVGRVSQKYFNSIHFMRTDVYRTMIQNPIKKMFAIMEICENRNIKFVMFSGLVYFDYFTINRMVQDKQLPQYCAIPPSEVIKILTNNSVFSEVSKKKKHFIGWPMMKEIGGYSFDDMRHNKEEYYISNLDRHPNAAGQILISSEFIKKYKELYN